MIASGKAGVSEIITHGMDGLILKDASDAARLAGLIEVLYCDLPLRDRLGCAAAATACRFTWEQNAQKRSN